MKNIITPTQKYCRKGNHIVDVDKFYKHPISKDGLKDSCIECCKKSRKENKRKLKEGTIKAF